MQSSDRLAQEFEAHRPRLRALAHRMLGSASEAEGAVQEAWLRLRGTDAAVENLGGWLTTVVARVSLDHLRARGSRREEPLAADHVELSGGGPDPADQAVPADAVAAALLVVLDTLTPAERVAFVLHDMFGVPFEDIAGVVGRSPAVRAGATAEVRGAAAVAETFSGRARAARPALVDGVVEAVWAHEGTPRVLFAFTLAGTTIVRIDLVADHGRLGTAEVQFLADVAS